MGHSEDIGYIRLAIAITKQAIKDYRKEYKKFLKTGEETTRLKWLEKWFKSEWGQMCSFGKGEVLMEYIQRGRSVKNERKGERNEW